jgi:hypothetical protein
MAGEDAAGHRSSSDDSAERMRRFEVTRDPADLWPGLTEEARVAAAQELSRVVQCVLAGETSVPVDPAGRHAEYALHIAAHTTGVGPLLGAWVEQAVVTGTATVLTRFRAHTTHSRQRAARIEAEVGPALDAICARGIVPVALKGFHTSHAYFSEPGLRRMADVDLCVPLDRVPDAEAALREAGFVPASHALRPYRRDWAPAGEHRSNVSLEYSHEQNPWVVELHASFDRIFHPGAVARFDMEREHVEPFTIAGRPLQVMRAPLLLGSLASHCSQELDGSRLLRLVEMTYVIRADLANGRLDWDELLAMMRRTRTARYCYPAFALLEDLMPGLMDARVLAAGRADSTWAARHTVARLTPAGGSPDDRGVLRQWMWTRGPVAVAQRLLRNAWPAAFTRPADVLPGWRVRMRRLMRGRLSLVAPDERRVQANAALPVNALPTAKEQSPDVRETLP